MLDKKKERKGRRLTRLVENNEAMLLGVTNYTGQLQVIKMG